MIFKILGKIDRRFLKSNLQILLSVLKIDYFTSIDFDKGQFKMIINTVVTFSVLDALTKRVMHFKKKRGVVSHAFFLYVMISYAFYHIIDEIQKKPENVIPAKEIGKKWTRNTFFISKMD